MAGLLRNTAAWLSITLAACVPPKAGSKGLHPESGAALETSSADNAEGLVLAAEVTEGFEFLYEFISETEFVLCLEGAERDGKIVIDGFRLARIEATSVNNVRYKPCTSARYIGTAHNHPPTAADQAPLCYQSIPDRRSFDNDRRAVVDIVLCGKHRFLWATKAGRVVIHEAAPEILDTGK